eukprot:GILI01002888.1.p1 GENE.GILI01002888.1~~GILI01002888.1.p1  ORF type:complete len:405 (-),score=85.58 GILI01002888.1:705-1919(-)
MNLPPPQPRPAAKMYAQIAPAQMGGANLMTAQRVPDYSEYGHPMQMPMMPEDYYGIQHQTQRLTGYEAAGFHQLSAASSGNSTIQPQSATNGYVVMPTAQMMPAQPTMSSGPYMAAQPMMAAQPILHAPQGYQPMNPGPFMMMQPMMQAMPQPYMQPPPMPQQQQMPTGQESICKDFLVGRCIRQQCRFVHLPPNIRPFPEDICKDYIRGTCTRQVCRFFHGTLQDYHTMRGIQQSSQPPMMYPNQLPPPSPAPEYMAAMQQAAMTPAAAIPMSNTTSPLIASATAQPPLPLTPSATSEVVHHPTSRFESETNAVFTPRQPDAAATPRQTDTSIPVPAINPSSFSNPSSAPSFKSFASVQAGSPLMVEMGTQTTPRLATRESLWKTTKLSSEVGTDAPETELVD